MGHKIETTTGGGNLGERNLGSSTRLEACFLPGPAVVMRSTLQHLGKELIYRATAEGCQFYSVGENGVDDQGRRDDFAVRLGKQVK